MAQVATFASEFRSARRAAVSSACFRPCAFRIQLICARRPTTEALRSLAASACLSSRRVASLRALSFTSIIARNEVATIKAARNFAPRSAAVERSWSDVS